MQNIIINSRNNTIIMTKKFAKAAQRYNSKEYKELQGARKDYPEYRVIIKPNSHRSSHFRGLTFEFMEAYIRSHDNCEENMHTYCSKRGLTGEIPCSDSYQDIKEWFLDTYPSIKNFCSGRTA